MHDDARPAAIEKSKSSLKNLVVKIVKTIDSNKENSRELRRTVFTHVDWIKFRSSERIFQNLTTVFNSILIQGLWLEIAAVTCTSFMIFGINKAIFSGMFEPFIPSNTKYAVSLPALPFQLSSSALGLLLVFRTNTVYTRWDAARTAWENVQTHCINLAREGLAYLKPSEKEEFIRRIVAFAFVMQQQFRTDPGGEERLQAKLQSLLGADESRRLMASAARPIRALADLSRAARRAPPEGGGRLQDKLDGLAGALVTCEGLLRSPVPLVYTRHTERFLALWTLLLPLALVRELGYGFAVVPMTALVGLFLFGIEEIGVQLEEPFSVLPIEDVVRRIEASAGRLLALELERVAADADADADADRPAGLPAALDPLEV